MRRKKLAQVADEIKDEMQETEPMPEKTEQKTIPENPADGTVKRRYIRRADTERLDKATIKAMLQTPFTLARAVTGFDGFKIPELSIDELTECGYRVYLDFGFEGYTKWFNLITFGTQYLGIFGGCMSMYMTHNKKLKAEQQKKENETKTEPEKTESKNE